MRAPPSSVGQDSPSPPHYSNLHRHCRRKQSGRSGMAGRYDSNPFEEEDVNPFSVRAPDPPPSSLVFAIPPCHCPGADLVSVFGMIFLPGARCFGPVWIWTGRRSDHGPAIEESICVFFSFYYLLLFLRLCHHRRCLGNSCCYSAMMMHWCPKPLLYMCL